MVTVVYAKEELPEKITRSIFLAGPTPRNREEVASWRPEAISILEENGFDGVVFVPEPRNKEFQHSYEDQVEWEEKCLNVADCIVFWIPRDISLDSKGYPKMPAFTTNVEFGAWCDSGKVVWGAPPDADKNTYLEYYAAKYKVSTADTLLGTLENAMTMLRNGAERTGGERFVPLFIWHTPAFQNWYQAQKEAGNRLDHARLLYNFRPGYKKSIYLTVLKVDVFVAQEQRNKSNEFVMTRPDISSVVMWHRSKKDGTVEVVLVKEFRSCAATKDGFIRELPAGSANASPRETAAEEILQETGFDLDPSRLRFQAARQLAGTFSSYKSNLYSVELTEEEVVWFKSQKDIVHGLIEDTEQTYVEVYLVSELIESDLTDWSTLGMILSVPDIYPY